MSDKSKSDEAIRKIFVSKKITSEFEKDAYDLKSLRSAVVDAAGVSGGLWLSYVFVLLYFFIAVGGITHADLLLERPVRLPFLNIDLPLLGFFVLGPLLFLVTHVYLMLHFVIFSAKVSAFDEELKNQVQSIDVQNKLRKQLPSNLFVQLLAGSIDSRRGPIGILLWCIASISLIVGPIALIFYYQIKFLPYHSESITWWHRIILLLDILFIGLLWQQISLWNRKSTFQIAIFVIVNITSKVLCIFILTISIFVVTAPNEFVHNLFPDFKVIPIKNERNEIAYASLHNILVAGEVDQVLQRPKSIWSNRLVLPGFSLPGFDEISEKEDNKPKNRPMISLRGRNLEQGVFIGAKLYAVDFTGAVLNGAIFNHSDLRWSVFGCPEFRQPEDACTKVQSTRFMGADMRMAVFNSMEFNKAIMSDANLQQAQMMFTNFDGTELTRANLSFTNIYWVSFLGANLNYANFSGSKIFESNFSASNIDRAKFFATTCESCTFRGTSSFGTFFQASKLHSSVFLGTYLSASDFLGADVSDTKFDSAWMENVRPWMTAFGGFEVVDSFVTLNRETLDKSYLVKLDNEYEIDNVVNDNARNLKKDADRRIGILKSSINIKSNIILSNLSRLARHNNKNVSEIKFFEVQKNLICNTENNEEEMAGLIRNFVYSGPPFVNNRKEKLRLAQALIKQTCAISSRVPKIYINSLEAIIKNINPPRLIDKEVPISIMP